MVELTQLKRELKSKGWSYRRAARRIGKSYQWISDVLNGNETSAPVLRKLRNLPVYANEKGASK